MYKFIGIILSAATLLFAGSVEELINPEDAWTKIVAIMPNCANSASDTCGPIRMKNARWFSMKFNGANISCSDSAIVDSGFTVRLYSKMHEDSTFLTVPNCADSLFDPFGTGSLDTRKNGSDALTLDAAPLYYVVITRTDTNPIVLDFKSDRTGLVNKDALVFYIIYK